MTINELFELCKTAKENGLGDREIMLPEYRLGNSHKALNGQLKAMESCQTTIEKRNRKKYIELS